MATRRQFPSKADSDWVTQSVELKVPAGATRLNIQPAMFHCTGVFEIADLTVTPHLVARNRWRTPCCQPASPWTGTKPRRNGECQAVQVSLNGSWRFVPAAEGAVEPPKLGWGYIKVPGDWQIHPNKPADFVAKGGGPQWDLYDGSLVTRAGISARRPFRRIGKVVRSAYAWTGCVRTLVYVNGKRCGRVAWPWGSVDITG